MDLQSLTLLANMLANKYNVDVRAEGSKAFCEYDHRTKKTTITVPSFTTDTDAQRVYVRGYIDHEIGHVRFTAFDNKNRNSTLHGITNILEDVYVERMMGQCYPGCALNLKAMQHQLFEVDRTFENCDGPAFEGDRKEVRMTYWYIMRYILYRARNISSLVGFARSDIERELPGLADKLEPLLQRVPSCRNSKDNDALAVEIYDVIKDYLKDEQDDTQEQESDSGQGDVSQEQGGMDKAVLKGELADVVDGNADVDFAYGISDKISNAVRDAIGDDTNSGKNGRSNSGVCSTVMQSCENSGVLAPISDGMRNEAAGCAAALSAQLQALMQAKALRKRKVGMYGKLDSNRLHRIVMNNPRVFLRSTEVRQVNTQVLILCDASGSMNEHRKYELTSKAVYALMKSLRNIHGVRSGAYAFGGRLFEAMSGFDQPLFKSKLWLKDCTGNTPGGSALQRALNELDLTKDDRKIVLLLTDGDFDRGERDVFRAVYKEAQAAGIDVIGVGINSNAVSNLWKDGDFFYITELKELAPKLFEILRTRIV